MRRGLPGACRAEFRGQRLWPALQRAGVGPGGGGAESVSLAAAARVAQSQEPRGAGLAAGSRPGSRSAPQPLGREGAQGGRFRLSSPCLPPSPFHPPLLPLPPLPLRPPPLGASAAEAAAGAAPAAGRDGGGAPPPRCRGAAEGCGALREEGFSASSPPQCWWRWCAAPRGRVAVG